jgi:hypothetical protein
MTCLGGGAERFVEHLDRHPRRREELLELERIGRAVRQVHEIARAGNERVEMVVQCGEHFQVAHVAP